MPTRVLLVRHGQSEWNAVGRWQGQADPPLSDVGRQQARSAAKALGALEAVFASDLQRAAETAIEKAKAKNIDGATVAYLELTMTCIRCHQHTREEGIGLVPPPTGDGIGR